MKILVIGSGGREHALVWKIAQSPLVEKIYCAPGNGGIAEDAECVTLSPGNIEDLIRFALKEKIDLTVVGPEMPLSKGIVDAFEKAELRIFGPNKNAAIIEASKCFTKEFCKRHNIPTADYSIFQSADEAKVYLKKGEKYPLVLKADGLAAGKGVVIAKNIEEALKSVDDMMVHERFGEAGRKIIVEEFMPGEEATYMIVTNGEHYVEMESSQDHKSTFDNDEGPNTGGMGAYSPAPVVSEKVKQKVNQKIIEPLLKGMKAEDRLYKGILYAGLMIHDDEPRLVEFNCRFGDPEAQAILYRMKSDLVELILSVLDGKAHNYKIVFEPQSSVCIVMSAHGYPGEYEKGKEISGLKDVLKMKDAIVFHAGTRKENNKILTNGGRVLGVTAKGDNLESAIQKAYQAVEKIKWEGAHFRLDIGQKGLKRLGT